MYPVYLYYNLSYIHYCRPAHAGRQPYSIRPLTSHIPFLFNYSHIPAESYPRYSNFDSPSNKIGAACFIPVNPTIPHIIILLPFLLYIVFSINYRHPTSFLSFPQYKIPSPHKFPKLIFSQFYYFSLHS